MTEPGLQIVWQITKTIYTSKTRKIEMFTFWFLNDSNLDQKINLNDNLIKGLILGKKTQNLWYWRISWKPIVSHVFPKEGDMELKESNHRLSLDFLKSAADLKKYVFINLRKQTRQKVEGFSAS